MLSGILKVPFSSITTLIFCVAPGIDCWLLKGNAFPEELFMTLMFYNHPELFKHKYFETWWCRDNAPKETPDSYFEQNKSFYKILEELNNINE